MKKISKKIFIGIITLIILLGAFITMSKAAVSYTNKDRTVIIGATGDGSGIINKQNYDLDKVNTVSVVQNTNWYSYGDVPPILNQPNVWCVEKGTNIGNTNNPVATYSVGKEVTVTDPILEYILANGPSMGTLENNYEHDAQIALWYYLSLKESDPSADKKNILSKIICEAPNSNKGDKLYQEAKEYATKISKNESISIKDFTINTSGDKLIIVPKVEGFSSFDVIINNSTTFENKTGRTEINLEQFNDEKLTISIKVNYEKMLVKYRILTSSKNQRLLVTTSIEKEETLSHTINKEIENPLKREFSVSLEKYITKVYSAADNYNSFVEYNNREWKRYNENGDEDNKNEYKFKNSIDVERGDIVEYTIKVTNTSKNGKFILKEITDIPNDNLLYCDKENGRFGLSDGWKWDADNNKIVPSNGQAIELDIGASKFITICFKISQEAEFKRIENKAEITKDLTTDNDNDGLENNADADYVVVVEYKVSLQKYITKINDNTIYKLDHDVNNDGFVDLKDSNYIGQYVTFHNKGTSNITRDEIEEELFKKMNMDDNEIINIPDASALERFVYSNRDNIREGIEEKEDDTSRKLWFKRLNYNNLRKDDNGNIIMEENLDNHVSLVKYNNPVEVELGDVDNPTKITYTIKINNNGDEHIYLTQIYDKPEINNEKGVKLENIKYVPRGVTSNYKINIQDMDEDGRYILNFEERIRLKKDEEIYIDVELELIYDNEKYDGSSVLLRNEAGIVSIQNKDGKKVTDADGDNNNHDCDFIKIQNYAVSLEKFITEVTDKNGENRVEYVGNNDRSEKRYNWDPESKLSDGDNNKNLWKYNNVVEVEKGDIVTYTIRLKNEGTGPIKTIEISDIPNTKLSEMKIVEEPKLDITIKDNGNICITKNDLLKPKDFIDIKVLFSVNGQTDNSKNELIENKANIYEIQNKWDMVIDSNGADDNYDLDYLKTKDYAVSLEKFVSKVESSNLRKTYYNKPNEREGYRHNEDLKDGDKNKSTNKTNNPVSVEVGDIVTFTIKLKNTGVTPVKITEISDIFTNDNGISLSYRSISFGSYSNNKIKLIGDDAVFSVGEEKNIQVEFKVIVPQSLTNISQQLENKAKITNIVNRNNETVIDSDTDDNNADKDVVITKTYAVSLEKYISSVTKVNGTVEPYQRDGEDGKYTDKSEHKYDNIIDTVNPWKYDNPVEVETGDKVTYTIKVKNDGDTVVEITNIVDYLPNGVKYNNVEYIGEKYAENNIFDINFKTDNIINISTPISLQPKSKEEITITVEVIEPNISVNIMKNVAEINAMKNRNGNSVEDTTGNNNKDADYIQMKDISISGIVWNDAVDNKTQDNYDGKFDKEKESKLGGITVKLYRESGSIPIATVTTNNEKESPEYGKYTFAKDDIKGPKENGTNRWAGEHYKYYVEFEYDGLKYTSTVYTNANSTNSLDSNAKEDISKRTEFNKEFSRINNTSGIKYVTKNENGYIPQSNYEYNSNKMKMHSSTELIDIGTFEQEQLKHINLGLRGRDIFDLAITSDVYSTKVTVNRQQGAYNYNSNKVTVRKSDIAVKEDMANLANEAREANISEVGQGIRNSDIQNNNYDTTGLEIEVTYKITVTNESITAGNATKITNYYDSKYEFVGAYNTPEKKDTQKRSIDEKLSRDPGEKDKYGYKIINMPNVTLGESASIDIYVVYKLKDPSSTLADLLAGTEKIPTYNMVEITEYKTYTTNKNGINDEATRGLIDKDSAPGSANEEQVRLVSTEGQSTPTTNGDPTTVEYYFAGNGLSNLKYEDDTYATPTLYFISESNPRTITGTVFRDETVTDKITRIKTGNGKIDEGEVGVYGAKVQLIELVEEGEALVGRERANATTGTDGTFKLEGFLPGNYIIRYYYGDTKDTVLKGQSEDKKVNIYSFNGEDYQATNNKYSIEGMDTNVLNTTEKFWYVYNQTEGISTATDNAERRNQVSNNVISENSDDIIKKLNAARSGQKEIADIDDLMEKTYMIADTNYMLLELEPMELINEKLEQRSGFGEYIVSNMNLGLAEVPVTTIDLQKEIESFTITDATGTNAIIRVSKDNKGNWVTEGNVIPLPEQFDVSIEDEKLQGARLEVTYGIKSNIIIERNYDKKDGVKATIAGLADIIDNNLSYNPELNGNNVYWTENNSSLEDSSIENVDLYKVIVNANNKAVDKLNKGEKLYITLEKVLSSTDSTLAEILTSTVDVYEYNNTIEITSLNYSNVTSGTDEENQSVQKDRIRTADRYIILPGQQHDTTASQIITIHPPTGDNSIHIVYYILAAISLTIIGAGIFGIKKFVLNNKQ